MSIVKYGAPSLAIPNLSTTTPSKLTPNDNVRSLTSSIIPKHAALSANTTSVPATNSNTSTKPTNHHPTNGPSTNNLNNHLYSNSAYGGMSSGYPKDSDSIYPKIITYPYPKPGGVNPTIHIHIVDLQSNSRNHKQITPPREIAKM